MKLFVLRHAKTERNSDSGKDFDRDLKVKGHNQLNLMREFFTDHYQDEKFNVYASTAVRVLSTLKGLETAININHVSLNDELYLPQLRDLLHFLSNHSDTFENILLIGHNNGLSDLCSYISGEEIILPTCGLLVYDFPEFSNINEISKSTGIEKMRFFPKV